LINIFRHVENHSHKVREINALKLTFMAHHMLYYLYVIEYPRYLQTVLD